MNRWRTSSIFQRLDFAPRQAWPWWLVTGLLAAALALGLGTARLLAAQRAQAANEASLASHERQRLARLDIPQAPPLPKDQVESVNDAITTLNTPWPALLNAIESVRNESVALTLLEPRAQDQRVRLSAQADSMDALVDFMERMSRTAPFDSATPLRQELAPAAGGPGAPGAAGTAGALTSASRRHQLTFELHWRAEP